MNWDVTPTMHATAADPAYCHVFPHLPMTRAGGQHPQHQYDPSLPNWEVTPAAYEAYGPTASGGVVHYPTCTVPPVATDVVAQRLPPEQAAVVAQRRLALATIDTFEDVPDDDERKGVPAQCVHRMTYSLRGKPSKVWISALPLPCRQL